MGMQDPNEIVNLAEMILSTVQSVYAEYGVTLPARQYLNAGARATTVHDGEQVTVSLDMAYSGLPGNQAQTPVRIDDPRTATFFIEVVRSLPTPGNSGRPPTPDTLTLKAKEQMVDAAVLLEAGLRAATNTFTKTGIVDVSAGLPQGGLQAMVLNLILVI
jgi:hypothetical protein